MAGWLRKVAINNDCDHHWDEAIATSVRRQCLHDPKVQTMLSPPARCDGIMLDI